MEVITWNNKSGTDHYPPSTCVGGQLRTGAGSVGVGWNVLVETEFRVGSTSSLVAQTAVFLYPELSSQANLSIRLGTCNTVKSTCKTD